MVHMAPEPEAFAVVGKHPFGARCLVDGPDYLARSGINQNHVIVHEALSRC